MNQNGRGGAHDEAGASLTRRTLLGSAGALAGFIGLAGCIGDSDGGSGDSGGCGGAIACSELTNGYESYESGVIAFVFDLKLPTAVLDSAEYEIVAGIFELDAESDWENGDTLEVTAQQNPNARSEVRFESASEFMQDVERSGTLSSTARTVKSGQQRRRRRAVLRGPSSYPTT